MRIDNSLAGLLTGSARLMKPTVGMGVTIIDGESMTPATVICSTKNVGQVTVQLDIVLPTRAIGATKKYKHSPYEFHENAFGETRKFSKRTDGRWVEINWAKNLGPSLVLNMRQYVTTQLIN